MTHLRTRIGTTIKFLSALSLCVLPVAWLALSSLVNRSAPQRSQTA